METAEPIDYIQFYNKKNNWHVQYRFIDRYSVPNMSTFSFERIVTKMEEDDELFSRYIASRQNKHFFKGVSATHRKPNMTRLKLKPKLGKLHPCIPAKHCYKACICRVKAIDFREYIECISKRKTILISSGISLQTDLVTNIVLISYIPIRMIACSV
ncbi:hypothetical protein ILUMI_06975 [Ignelater luminosus]|uniref:Uncharacterized protein n=1 Tax=Ignelater luminosus TaxID=2038154 RepID=A0A8K0DEF4_IGNLU|nr:hypothetical protein ILUMI_06975 [Ignelater luminosus]